ncbi:MAG: COX15/CtaA family protein [Planctomycetota bacterium]|jgi:cytochrome c oxidase assembly protein subunit 15
MSDHASATTASSPPAAAVAGRPPRGHLPAIAFGTTTLLWASSYLCLVPGSVVPRLLLGLIVAVLLAGSGWLAARVTGRGLGVAVRLALALTGINALIVGSLQSQDTTGGALLASLAWISGFAAAAIVLCAIGAWLASLGEARREPVRSWTSRFATVVALTTLPLLISGGVVTGLEAGLAVPDWLTTFEYPMMFYPMVKMQADTGVYVEHFHRLWGLLVGLSVIALVVHLHRNDDRRAVRLLSVAILAAVIVQGVIGGGRVVQQVVGLAVAHGIFGQVVFATIAAIAAAVSTTWISGPAPETTDHAGREGRLSAILVGLVLAQITLGAFYRHLSAAADAVPTGMLHGVLGMHVLLGVIIAIKMIFIGGRAMVWHGDRPVLPRLGAILMILVGLQIIFGIIALVTVMIRPPDQAIPVYEVITTTVHQATGALLLAGATLFMLWTRRLLQPADGD